MMRKKSRKAGLIPNGYIRFVALWSLTGTEKDGKQGGERVEIKQTHTD